MIITAVLLLVFLASIFIPLANLNITVSNDEGGRQQALTRPLLLFGIGALTAYFGGFLLILRNLRMIFRTLTIGDPFRPENVRRLRQIGLIPGVMDSQGTGELLTPIFSVLVVFVLAEVFREGARLRRESELTI
jgi:hypothetical protein